MAYDPDNQGEYDNVFVPPSYLDLHPALIMPRLGFSRAYKEGWNAASMGALAHQNPYPNVDINDKSSGWWNMAGAYAKDVPGQTNWNLWLSGYYDYMVSPYNCEARRRYMLFRIEMVREFVTVDAAQDGTLYIYQDGSSIDLTDEGVEVIDRKGDPFIRLEFEKDGNLQRSENEAQTA
jgi:hypothetical protein